MQYKVSVSSDSRSIVTKSITADAAINIIAELLLTENIPTGFEDIEHTDNAGETMVVNPIYQPKTKYKAAKNKVAKALINFDKSLTSKRRGKSALDDAKIYQVLDLIKENATIAEIKGKAKIAVGTYYKIKTGQIKPTEVRGKVSETPTAIGERAIDKKASMLTTEQYDEAKEAHDDGMASGAIAFSLGLDTEQVRKALKCDNYTQYTAEY